MVDSARALGGEMVGVDAGMVLEREMGDLNLGGGKVRSMAPSSRGMQHQMDFQHGGNRLSPRDGEATMRSQHRDAGAAQKEFDDFASTRQSLYGNLREEGEDVLADFDMEKFLSQDPAYTYPTKTFVPGTRAHDQCAESSAHALPTELRSLALDRLRQIGGHIATSLSAVSASREAQRRAELENEWLLWWDESPTACFDDSREYFFDSAQQSYAEAWEKHLEDPARINVQKPYLNRDTVLRPLQHGSAFMKHENVQPRQPSSSQASEEETHRCPNRKSHEDLAACRRSTPIAAQHRPCPHAGCGFCSTSSAGWFEHLRTCAV